MSDPPFVPEMLPLQTLELVLPEMFQLQTLNLFTPFRARVLSTNRKPFVPLLRLAQLTGFEDRATNEKTTTAPISVARVIQGW
jgi:hypothetical protein